MLEIDPEQAEALYVLGGIALNDGDTAAAIDLVRRAIDADPNNATFHFSLGSVLASIGRSREAIPYFQDAVRLRPDLPDWRQHLAVAMHEAKPPTGTVAASSTDTGQRPTDAQGFFDLGTTFQQRGRLEDAEAAYQEAIRLAPQMAAPQLSLAAVQLDQGRPVEAEIAARHALETGPETPDVLYVLGSALSAQARHVEAADYLNQAVEQRPDFEVAWNCLLFAMTYSDRWSAREIYESHVRWGQRFAPAAHRSVDPSHRGPGHRLRIAYLSPDYRQHPIAFFIEAPLQHHDRTRFEVFCYHTDGRVDATTRRLKALADHWRWMVAPSEQALEQVIREDGIDILVELSGHTEGHQLGVLARRVAPVQMTYVGYPNSTGLPAIDYRITDARADPPGEADRLHVEKLLRLPDSFLCYTPADSTIDIATPPVRRNGFITFGSFNNFAKLSSTLLGLWARILASVPGSRLMIKTRGLQDPGLRTLLLE
jgi:predicted O-linked N-acetylglucosamine transferase (SPINDLY family)